MRNISVKIFWICTSGSGGDVVWLYFLSGALTAPLFGREELYAKILVGGVMRNSSVKSFWICTSGSGGNVVWRFSYLELWQPLCSFVQFWYKPSRGTILWNNFEFLTSGSGDVVWRYFLSIALAASLFGRAEPFVQFLVETIRGKNLRNYFEDGQVVKKMLFKDISHLELWQPFC